MSINVRLETKSTCWLGTHIFPYRVQHLLNYCTVSKGCGFNKTVVDILVFAYEYNPFI